MLGAWERRNSERRVEDLDGGLGVYGSEMKTLKP